MFPRTCHRRHVLSSHALMPDLFLCADAACSCDCPLAPSRLAITVPQLELDEQLQQGLRDDLTDSLAIDQQQHLDDEVASARPHTRRLHSRWQHTATIPRVFAPIVCSRLLPF